MVQTPSRRDRPTGRGFAFLGLAVVSMLAASAHGQFAGEKSTDHARRPPPYSGPPNILLLIADDFGTDVVGAYGEHPDPGNTPVIDGLAANGILFRNAWSNPTCSPTRATLLTGRYGFRTGIGYVIDYEDFDFELSVGEVALPEILKPLYRTAAVGKWHLSTEMGSGPAHPMEMGFDHHRGAMCNLPVDELGYFDFEKSIDGTLVQSTTYATTDTVDDAVQLIESSQQPWFLWVAFNAPHSPYHKPPDELHTFDLPADVDTSKPEHMRAMAEAMDTEIGRLITSMHSSVRANTVIIFVGDNGTPKPAVLPPFDPDHTKPTIYEGGINVPLIIVGPNVAAGAECTALVNLTDLYATIADLAGVASAAEDSISLAPYLAQPDLPSIRRWAYSEFFRPNGFGPYDSRRRVARGPGYKLVFIYGSGTTPNDMELYDLVADPFETTNLLLDTLTPEAQEAFTRLSHVLNVVVQ